LVSTQQSAAELPETGRKPESKSLYWKMVAREDITFYTVVARPQIRFTQKIHFQMQYYYKN